MARDQNSDVIDPQQGKDFVETPYIRELAERALSYLQVRFPIHLRGSTGVGKTTLALHIAAKLERPSVLISGDHEFSTSDLVGGIYGYRRHFMKDNFIRSVLKTEESMTQHWIDDRLTTACRYGLTLIYDEFTRSRPEANNVLLSILEEGVLALPTANGKESYINVHPEFRAIFTSNPEEYAGVNSSQDALQDRMLTLEFDHFDEETEVAITRSRSGISEETARRIVGLVRDVRGMKADPHTPTVRACILIGRVMVLKGISLEEEQDFQRVCEDALIPDAPAEERSAIRRAIAGRRLSPFRLSHWRRRE